MKRQHSMSTDAKELLNVAQVEEACPAAVERYQLELDESRNRLEQMIDIIPTLAWSCRPDGTTEFLNQRWLDYK